MTRKRLNLLSWICLLYTSKSRTDVRSFHEDKQGNIWVGTSEGVYLIDCDSKTIKAHYNLENNLARCVLKDSEDQVWVGFFGGGLGLYDPQLQSIQLFNVLAKFPSNTINALYEDSRKRLWVATGEGLVCFPSLTDRNYKVCLLYTSFTVQAVVGGWKRRIFISAEE